MAKVKYRGPYDARVLNKEDMVRLGAADNVDFSKTRFNQGEAVEVPDSISKLLVENKALKNQFEAVDEKSTPAADAAPAGKK